MTRRQALEDLFLAVRKYLINEGRNKQTATYCCNSNVE